MTEYLLDTNLLSYLQERHPKVLRRLAAVPIDDLVVTSVVGVAELLRGVYLLPESRRRRELLELYHQVIQQMDEVLPITRVVAEEFAHIDAALHKYGRPIPVNDVWVAALAAARGAVLVTNDEHFSRVGGLRIEDWTR